MSHAEVYPLVGLTPPPGPIGWAGAPLPAAAYLVNIWMHLALLEKPVFRSLRNPSEFYEDWSQTDIDKIKM